MIAIIRGENPAGRLPQSLWPLVASISKDGKIMDDKPLVVLRGDVSFVGFQVVANEKPLLDQVTVVIHCAANIKFHEPLGVAIAANVSDHPLPSLLLLQANPSFPVEDGVRDD